MAFLHSDIPLEEGDIVTIDTVAELDRGLVFDQSQVLSYKIAEETQGLYGFD
jgi:methionine aminopeptidase